MDNQPLGKTNLSLNKFEFNLEVNPRIFLCEPQIFWIQIYFENTCNEEFPRKFQ
jgi:hypothetical protein